MFIFTGDAIIDDRGKAVFYREIKEGVSWMRSGDGIPITGGDDAEALACVADLAERLYAHKWDSEAHCFVPVRYEPDDVRRIIQYMSHDDFPVDYVKGILDIVTLLNYTKESEQDVWGMIEAIRGKEYNLGEGAQ